MTVIGTRLLLVEDDERLSKALLDALQAAGHSVDVATSLQDARWATERSLDLIVLDLGLPDGDGLELCRELRSRGDGTPVLVLTARDAPHQCVRGLDVGADDYVVKPFYLPELMARIRGLLRRAGREVGPALLVHADLWLDLPGRRAGRGEEELRLTRREFDLLHFLMRHPGRTWTRAQLLERVWGMEFDRETRTVDLHVQRLRSHVEQEATDPRLIETVWGIGYRMADV